MDGCRITEEDTDAGVVAARKQAPRSLWDLAYTENSWIAQFSTNGPIRLLPRLEDKIAANYPGTKLSITEYNYGGANHISGGIAQADALGVFGREGLFAATLWRLVAQQQFHLRRLRHVPQLRRRQRQLRRHQHPRHDQRRGQHFRLRQRRRRQREPHGAGMHQQNRLPRRRQASR
jgi:hypothetical protein